MLVSLLAVTAAAFSPPEDVSDLHEQIIAADDILFERAFNECDLEALEEVLLPMPK